MTQNFKISEFDCRDGTAVPVEYYNNLLELVTNLQLLRNFIDAPITIVSGYRSVSHNEKVGGAKFSQHLTASASDIRAKGYTTKELGLIIEALILTGRMKNGGLGVYENFVHYDIGKPRRW